MTKRMTDVELDTFREALATLAQRGTEAEVKAHINAFFPRLPQAMQNELIANMFLTSLQAEALEGDEEETSA